MSTFVTDLKELSDGIAKMIPADDNVKLDMASACSMIQTMKLSLQIESFINSGRIVNYLKTKQMRFPLPYALGECDPAHECIQKNTYLIFGTSKLTKFGWETEYHYCKPSLIECKWNSLRCRFEDVPVSQDIQSAYFSKYPLFELFRKISPCNTLDKASSFCGISNRAFDPVAKGLHRVGSTVFFSTAHEDQEYWESFRKKNPCRSEAELVEWELNQIISRVPDQQCNDLYSSVFEADQKLVYDFQDCNGSTLMKMLKKYTYTPRGTSKSYIPLSNMMFHGEPYDRLFTIPTSDKQMLYNLQYFRDSEYVVICPNIEIADKLQRSSSFKNVVFTSFVCNHGFFHQVDFTELEDKNVVLLLVNHSRMEIEDAVMESKELYTYLKDQQKRIRYNELNAVQIAVRYRFSGDNVDSMRSYLKQYQKPEVIPESAFLISSEEEFETNYSKSEEYIKIRDQEVKPYWMIDAANDGESSNEVEKQPGEVEELMRGIIARNCVTYIIGKSGVGKSSLTASLCAYLVNTSERAKRPIAERFWTRCKIKSDYERLKIVHLDFDNNKGFFAEREKTCINSYMPDDSKEQKECKANYIVKSIFGDPVNYSAEENFTAFCDLLDSMVENEGVKGQPIDILVIDTYWSFTHKKDTNYNIFRKLIHKYPGMAVIALHHLNDDGMSYGRQDKLFEADTTILMNRNGNGTLKTPFTVQIGEKHRLISCDEDLKPFNVMLDEENHFVCVQPTDEEKKKGYAIPNEAAMLQCLKKGYKKDSVLAKLLGMSVNTLRNKLNK